MINILQSLVQTAYLHQQLTSILYQFILGRG